MGAMVEPDGIVGALVGGMQSPRELCVKAGKLNNNFTGMNHAKDAHFETYNPLLSPFTSGRRHSSVRHPQPCAALLCIRDLAFDAASSLLATSGYYPIVRAPYPHFLDRTLLL